MLSTLLGIKSLEKINKTLPKKTDHAVCIALVHLCSFDPKTLFCVLTLNCFHKTDSKASTLWLTGCVGPECFYLLYSVCVWVIWISFTKHPNGLPIIKSQSTQTPESHVHLPCWLIFLRHKKPCKKQWLAVHWNKMLFSLPQLIKLAQWRCNDITLHFICVILYFEFCSFTTCNVAYSPSSLMLHLTCMKWKLNYFTQPGLFINTSITTYVNHMIT